jgi:hypothetical protein
MGSEYGLAQFLRPPDPVLDGLQATLASLLLRESVGLDSVHERAYQLCLCNKLVVDPLAVAARCSEQGIVPTAVGLHR